MQDHYLMEGLAHQNRERILERTVYRHRHRIGTHHKALPINAPKCSIHNYHLGGAMRFTPNAPIPDAYYEPDSFNGPGRVARISSPPLNISGDADRYNHSEGNDDFSQPHALFNLMDAGQKVRLFSNIAAARGAGIHCGSSSRAV